MVRVVVLLLALLLLVCCGQPATFAPDLVATEVAVQRAAAATLTAEAPVAATMTAMPTATDTATPAPAATATVTVGPTAAPSATATASPVPVLPSPTLPVPPVGPSLGKFAVVNVASDDVLNVRARPGANHAIVGTVPYYGRDVAVYAGGQEVGGSWWVPVQHSGVQGWVNSNYLARQVGSASDAVAALAAQAILALRDRNWAGLANLVHPVKGVTFSPYTYVRPLQGAPGEADLVFSADQLRGLWSDPTVYYWGVYDGSGEPIELTFPEYYDRFIYDVDFARPDIVGFGETVGKGNTINNIAAVYPNAVTVEYHFEGFDSQYGGLDWRSLRLVLEPVDGVWYVVGIVHDEWTI
jgi:hypothetical protein